MMKAVRMPYPAAQVQDCPAAMGQQHLQSRVRLHHPGQNHMRCRVALCTEIISKTEAYLLRWRPREEPGVGRELY